MNTFNHWVSIGEALMQLSMVTMVGLYFIFSNTIMKSLSSVDNGAEVMVTINQVILNHVFMTFFIISGISSMYFVFAGQGIEVAGAAVFFLGTTLVTIVKNVPMNNQLLEASTGANQQQVWAEYQSKWVYWNHVRTISGLFTGFALLV